MYALGKCIKIDDELVSILLYADHVVLLDENEADLQVMLNVLGDLFKTKILSINATKSNIVHFRNPSVTRSDFVFRVNEENIAYATHYKYLGLVPFEHLNYALTTKVVAQSANNMMLLLSSTSQWWFQ